MNVSGTFASGASGLRLACFVAVLVGHSSPSTLRSQPGAAPGDITFTKDIVPILQRSCQQCHRPNGVAPMSQVTYEEVRPWARAIKEKTLLGPHGGVMPPWFVKKTSAFRSSRTIRH
jgi:hypothetical protein